MFSALKSAYYSKKKGKRSDEEKKDPGTPPPLLADQSSSKDPSHSTSVLMGNRNSSATPTNSSQSISTSLRVVKRVDNRFTSDAESSEQIKAERDLNPAYPSHNWFPEISTGADVPDHAKSSPVFAQLGNYGPAAENRTQKSPTENITQKNLAPVKWFSPPSNINHRDDGLYNTSTSPSASIQPGSHGPIDNQQAQNNPTPTPSKSFFNPTISPLISAQDESCVPVENKGRGDAKSVKKFSLRPEIPNTSNRQTTESNLPKAFPNLTPSKIPISYDNSSGSGLGSPTKNTFHFSAQRTSTTKNQFPLFPVTTGSILSGQGSPLLESRNQGIMKEREIKYSAPDLSTTPKMPGAFPARSPSSSITDGSCQDPLAEDFQRPPTSSPIQSTAVPAFNFSSPFSFSSSQRVHSPHRIGIHPSPPPHSPTPSRADVTPTAPIFNPPVVAPLFSPAHLASIKQNTQFRSELRSKIGPVDLKPRQNISSQAASSKEPIPAMAQKVTSIPKAKTRAIYDQANPPPSFSPENVARFAAGNFTPFEKKPQLPAEVIPSSVEKNQFSTGAKFQLSTGRIQSSNKEFQPSNKGSQPLREGIQRTNEKENACFGKGGEHKGESITSEKPVNIQNKPNNVSTEPKINRPTNMSDKKGCTLFMENIKSSVSSERYQSFVSIIAELYSHRASFELFELKAHDLMKRILIWFSHQPSLSNIVNINRLLPVGNSFTVFNYWEKESLRIVLSVSCIGRVSYVDVWMVGDLGFKNKQAFRIAEYKLQERGPLHDSMVWTTLLGSRSLIMTSCGLFYACLNPECETILEKVTSKLRRMSFYQGAPPDDILVELFCENSLAEQELYAMRAAALLPKKECKSGDKDEWAKFVKARRDREDSIIGVGLEKTFTGAERARLPKSKYIGKREDVGPSPSSEDSVVEELLEKMQKPYKLSAASTRKIKKNIAAAKCISHGCEAALGKMAGIIKKNTEAGNIAVPKANNQLAVPKVNNPAVPKVNNQLAVPKANNLAVPKANDLSVPKANNLAVPEANNQLAVPKSNNQLAVPKPNYQLAIPKSNYLAVPQADTRPGLARDTRMDMGSRARRFTVVEDGVEFIMEKPEQADDEQTESDSEFGEEMGKKQGVGAGKKKATTAATAATAVQEQEQVQNPPKQEAPKQGANANKGKNKGKKGKKGKNIGWKRL